MVRFENYGNYTEVYLDKKKAGSIVRVAGGFQYRPKGTKENGWGEVFASLQLCKDDVQGE